MKYLIVFILCSVILVSNSQIPYTQGFNSTLAGSNWVSLNLTLPWGNTSFFGFSNSWQVNDNESGRPAGTCGGANLGNPCLFIGAAGLASGAAYLSNANTNRRIISPVINTTGFFGLQLSFKFIGNGAGTADKAYLIYSVDGGANWINALGTPTTVNPTLPTGSNLNNLKSQLCAPQGRWTNITWDLPAICDNITNLRIGFVWQNNSTSSGPTDPSFAVDDVSITVPIIILPVESSSLKSRANANGIDLFWQTFVEIGNKNFDIERSIDAINYTTILNVAAKGPNYYSVVDETANFNTLYYYRFKQNDFNGNFKYSNITSSIINSGDILKIYPNPATNQLNFFMIQKSKLDVSVELFNADGNSIFTSKQTTNLDENYTFSINTRSYSNGIYFYKFSLGTKVIVGKVLIEN